MKHGLDTKTEFLFFGLQVSSMKEESVKLWALVGAIALMLAFSYLFMLSNEDNVSLMLLFAAFFLVLVLTSIVVTGNKKRR